MSPGTQGREGQKLEWVPCSCSHTAISSAQGSVVHREAVSIVGGTSACTRAEILPLLWENPSDCKLQASLSFPGLRTAFPPKSPCEGHCHLKQKCQKKAGREYPQKSDLSDSSPAPFNPRPHRETNLKITHPERQSLSLWNVWLWRKIKEAVRKSGSKFLSLD